MAGPTSTPEDEPIDVEFTSAEPVETVSPTASGGPGWVSLITVGVVAALSGGAIGVVAGGTDGRYAQASEVAVDISRLAESDRALKAELTLVGETLRSAELRLSTLADTSGKADTESLGRLEALRGDFEALKSAYVALVGGDQTDPQPDGTDTGAPTPDNETNGESDEKTKPVIPAPGVSLASVMARLEAIEAAGKETDLSAPGGIVRNLAALQERTAELEKADAALSATLLARETLLKSLSGDIDTLQASLLAADGRITETAAGLVRTETESKQAREDISDSLEALRKVVNERLSKIEGAKLTRNEEALIRRADRVLALSTLETAIRSGDPFGDELEKLALQLPANTGIAALRRIAPDGAPPLARLRAELVPLQSAVAKAGIPEKPRGQWAWLGDLLSSVMSFREEGSTAGQTASQKVAAAVSQIEAGDLETALTGLRTIDGPQGEVLANWISRAERRAQTDRLLERLRGDVINLEEIE